MHALNALEAHKIIKVCLTKGNTSLSGQLLRQKENIAMYLPSIMHVQRVKMNIKLTCMVIMVCTGHGTVPTRWLDM